MTKILLAGATGMVGEAVLARLLADERVTRVVAPTRRPLAPHAKLLNPITTIEDLPHDAEWWAVDGVICALGTTRAKTPSATEYRAIDYGYPLTIATLAHRNGATRFALTSSTGANSQSLFRYTRMKGDLEEAIDRLDYPSLTLVRPGFLGGTRREARRLERFTGIALRIVGPVLPVGVRVNPASTVAALLVEGALQGEPGKRIITSAEIVRSADSRR
ncbi:MAG: NAD(P)H-binding protein [Sphingobium sp.]